MDKGYGNCFVLFCRTGSYGQSPSVLEARYSWSDGAHGLASAGNANELVEDQLRQHLEDAMNESPLKDVRTNKGWFYQRK